MSIISSEIKKNYVNFNSRDLTWTYNSNILSWITTLTVAIEDIIDVYVMSEKYCKSAVEYKNPSLSSGSYFLRKVDNTHTELTINFKDCDIINYNSINDPSTFDIELIFMNSNNFEFSSSENCSIVMKLVSKFVSGLEYTVFNNGEYLLPVISTENKIVRHLLSNSAYSYKLITTGPVLAYILQSNGESSSSDGLLIDGGGVVLE